MNAIGFRVAPTEISYAIVQENGKQNEIISISSLKIPASIGVSEQLSYIRKTFETIISQYDVSFAGIKLIEGNARTSINNSLIFRFNVEGVLMELFTNSTVRRHFLGVASNIASTLNISKQKPLEMLTGVVDLTNVVSDSGKRISTEQKEAILVALAALESGARND